MFSPFLLILPQVEESYRSHRPARAEGFDNCLEDSALALDVGSGVLRLFPTKVHLLCLFERRFSQFFGVRVDLFRPLPLLVEKLQLVQQGFVWIISLGRLPALPAHGVPPLEEYVRGPGVPMQTARTLSPSRVVRHVRVFLRSANSVKSHTNRTPHRGWISDVTRKSLITQARCCPRYIGVPACLRTNWYDFWYDFGTTEGFGENRGVEVIDFIWLPPRDSNPDLLIQRQLSYH